MLRVRRFSGPYGIAAAVCLILAFQAAAMRSLTINEDQIAVPGLHQLPTQIDTWKASGEQFMDATTVAYLKPDEYILRDYVDERSGSSIGLFVAFFKSLQSQYGPHSPRICLPGSGWLVSSSKVINLPVAGRAEGIPANEFTMEKSNQRILVLYWYQNDRAIWSDEFYGKIRLVPDLIRYHRSDVSLVRMISPLQESTPQGALNNCVRFTQRVYPFLEERFRSVH